MTDEDSPTMSVRLTDRLERLIEESVEESCYKSKSEFAREAFRRQLQLEQRMSENVNKIDCPNCTRVVTEVNFREDKGDCVFCGLEGAPPAPWDGEEKQE